MSGHSKWSTIKHKKEATDKVRGKVFAKLGRAISVAIKTGGGNNPDTNHKLRMAIDIAKQANMPKANVERALAKSDGGTLEEVVYEGFGPKGIAVMVEVATDNRNRTAQELKTAFERGGGNLAGPGAVSFNFEQKGLILIGKQTDLEDQMLQLIDQGVDDVEEVNEGVEAYVAPGQLALVKTKLESNGFSIISSELFQKPKSLVSVHDRQDAEKTIKFLNTLEDHDDVLKVFANVDLPENITSEL